MSLNLNGLGTIAATVVFAAEVRFAVEDASKGREFEHRLTDYNNLPETRFSDIKRILAAARARVTARLRAASH